MWSQEFDWKGLWFTLIIPAPRRLRQENCKSEASLSYTERSRLKQNKKTNKITKRIRLRKEEFLEGF
jgi:hypothetical protein